MKNMFDKTSVMMAREAAKAINEFMAHWNDTVPEKLHNNTFHGAKVVSIARILATPEYHSDTTTLWEVSFDTCEDLWFEICDGVVHFPQSRLFSAKDLAE